MPKLNTGLVSVLGAWLPSLLWGESITTPFGFLGAIAVQSTGHQFRMLLAKTAPFVRVDVCIVRLPASTSERTVMRVCNADLQIMGGDEAALHQIAALNEALTLAVSLLAWLSARLDQSGRVALSFTCC